jgi:hypothetical protein
LFCGFDCRSDDFELCVELKFVSVVLTEEIEQIVKSFVLISFENVKTKIMLFSST